MDSREYLDRLSASSATLSRPMGPDRYELGVILVSPGLDHDLVDEGLEDAADEEPWLEYAWRARLRVPDPARDVSAGADSTLTEGAWLYEYPAGTKSVWWRADRPVSLEVEALVALRLHGKGRILGERTLRLGGAGVDVREQDGPLVLQPRALTGVPFEPSPITPATGPIELPARGRDERRFGAPCRFALHGGHMAVLDERWSPVAGLEDVLGPFRAGACYQPAARRLAWLSVLGDQTGLLGPATLVSWWDVGASWPSGEVLLPAQVGDLRLGVDEHGVIVVGDEDVAYAVAPGGVVQSGPGRVS